MLTVDAAVTVITWLALPVPNRSGSAVARPAVLDAGGEGDWRAEWDGDAGDGEAADDEPRAVDGPPAAVRAMDVARGAVVVALDADGLDADGLDGLAEHAVKAATTATPTTLTPAPTTLTQAPRAVRCRTPSGCHVTPIRMRGCAFGVSQRSRLISFVRAIATHPAVGVPSVTCRKKALPLP